MRGHKIYKLVDDQSNNLKKKKGERERE